MARLTKKIVDAAVPRQRPYFIWCGELSGFGLRVFPSGKRTYYADYRNRDGVRRRMALGPHGKLTADEARKLAVVAFAGALKGGDPAAERATRRNTLTVGELCDKYMQAAEGGLIVGKRGRPKKASTLYNDQGRIQRHIKPLLGTKRVHELRQADVNRFIRDVAAGKTAVVEKTAKARGKAVVTGGMGAATRCVGLLGSILSFAVSEGVIPFNPVHGVKTPAYNRRTRRLNAEEYRALGAALQGAEDEGSNGRALMVMRLLALTGCRVGEVTNLKWSEVDFEGRCWRLEDSKTGASVRPIGRAALDVLGTVEPDEPVAYLFPAARGKGPVTVDGMRPLWRKIVQGAALEGVTFHTLRHSYASMAGDLGFTEHTIAALVGHAASSVTSRYIHHLDSVLIAAADRVAARIHELMTGEQATVLHTGTERLSATTEPIAGSLQATS